MKKLQVSVTGCSLADVLYAHMDFQSEAFRRYAARTDGDGGLQSGKLVFADALEKFAGVPYDRIRKELTGGIEPDGCNVGGPAIVGAINAAQLLYGYPVSVEFYGATGDDPQADFLRKIIARTPVGIRHYLSLPGATPCTDVLSDPGAHGGKGERTFINTIGACYDYTPEKLDDSFFQADVAWFGATALTPPLHENLSTLLKRAKANGALTAVNTVFDFINEKRDPKGPWPMGDGKAAYPFIDLLVVDWDEAVRLAGSPTLEGIHSFFSTSGVGAYAITHGAKDFYVWSGGRVFAPQELVSLPVSALVDEDLAAHPEKRGDTTGCGDNFAGGFICSMIRQLAEEKTPGRFDLRDAAAWAAASGGFACFCLGGTYVEKTPGEKQRLLQRYHDAYLEQIR